MNSTAIEGDASGSVEDADESIARTNAALGLAAVLI